MTARCVLSAEFLQRVQQRFSATWRYEPSISSATSVQSTGADHAPWLILDAGRITEFWDAPEDPETHDAFYA